MANACSVKGVSGWRFTLFNFCLQSPPSHGLYENDFSFWESRILPLISLQVRFHAKCGKPHYSTLALSPNILVDWLTPNRPDTPSHHKREQFSGYGSWSVLPHCNVRSASSVDSPLYKLTVTSHVVLMASKLWLAITCHRNLRWVCRRSF